MVLYSIAIINKQGKPLISRMLTSKAILEEDFENFPKLISAEQQHSFIEFDKSRYLYIPIEELFIIVITNLSSNIIEDMGVLKLIYSLVIDVCGSGITEKKIMDNAVDLLLCFDDIVNLGSRESVSLQQLKSYIEMESSDEKSFLKEQKMKESEAIEVGKKKQIEIRKRKVSSEKSTPEKQQPKETEVKPMPVEPKPSLVNEKQEVKKNIGKKAMNLFK